MEPQQPPYPQQATPYSQAPPAPSQPQQQQQAAGYTYPPANMTSAGYNQPPAPAPQPQLYAQGTAPPPQSAAGPAQPKGVPPQQYVDPARAGYDQPPAYTPPPVSNNTVSNNTVVVTQPTSPQVIIAPLVRPADHMVLSILVCVFCNWMFGLIALVFSISSQSSASAGDIESARRQGRIALWVNIAGVIFTTAVIVIVVSIAVAGGFASDTDNDYGYK